MHLYTLEFGFLTTVEKLIVDTVRGQLSYAVGNARALGSVLRRALETDITNLR